MRSPGYEIPTRRHPRLEAEVVGLMRGAEGPSGDILAFTRRGPDLVLALIGDVAGKGPEASARARVLEDLFLAAARRPGRGLPAARDLLGPLDRYLRETAEEPGGWTLVTCCLLRVDLRRQRLLYTNLGHCSPWAMERYTRRPTELRDPCRPGENLVLGLVPNPRIHSRQIRLRAGTGLLGISDGITDGIDPLNPGRAKAAIEAVLRGSHGLRPEEVTSRVVELPEDASSRTGVVDDRLALFLRIVRRRRVGRGRAGGHASGGRPRVGTATLPRPASRPRASSFRDSSDGARGSGYSARGPPVPPSNGRPPRAGTGPRPGASGAPRDPRGAGRDAPGWRRPRVSPGLADHEIGAASRHRISPSRTPTRCSQVASSTRSVAASRR